MTQSSNSDPTVRLVKNRLNEAENHLKAHNVAEAQTAFLEALKVKGDHPNRKSDIRRVVKLYCEDLVVQPRPDWENIHKAVELVERLDLHNEEMQSFERDLTLKEAQFLLEMQDDLDRSFAIFTRLLTDETHLEYQGKLKEQIAHIVSAYISDRAVKQEWTLLDKIFTHVQAIWPAGDSIHDWLKTMAQIIKAANQGKEGVHSELEQERKKSRSLTYALAGLLILAAVAYPLAFILG